MSEYEDNYLPAREIISHQPERPPRKRDRNFIIVDLGDDFHGIKPALVNAARDQCRTQASVVREILKLALVDGRISHPRAPLKSPRPLAPPKPPPPPTDAVE